MEALNKVAADCTSNPQSGILTHDSETGGFIHEQSPFSLSSSSNTIQKSSTLALTTSATKYNALSKNLVSEQRINEFQRSRDAVALVVCAFSKQDDEEQSARLERKNIQVMDRLAKMQAHKRVSILTIRDSYGR